MLYNRASTDTRKFGRVLCSRPETAILSRTARLPVLFGYAECVRSVNCEVPGVGFLPFFLIHDIHIHDPFVILRGCKNGPGFLRVRT
jgi:hypothetical protein